LGLSILAIGVWAWTEKDTFNNLSLLTNIALDPAFIFILAGFILICSDYYSVPFNEYLTIVGIFFIYPINCEELLPLLHTH
jgi:hypothetical protein